MKYILELDGGGIWGVGEATLLTECEREFKFSSANKFNLIAGSSTGAILGSCLSMGASAQACKDIYVNKGKQLFQPRSKWNPFNWLKPKYDRQPILDELKRIYDSTQPAPRSSYAMRDCKTMFMCTSVSMIDERTHFFKSWEREAPIDCIADASRDLVKTVGYSFAADYYFGAMVAPEERQVWVDGGEGQDNCSLRHCLVEALRQRWLPMDTVKILSLGCGYPKVGLSYEEASSSGIIGQTKVYINLANRQSATDQVLEVGSLSNVLNVEVLRLDVELPAACNQIDAVSYIGYAVDTWTKLYKDNENKLMKFFI